MKKYVILFQGGVETQEYFSVQMAQAFQKAGYGIYWFDLMVSGHSARLLQRFYEETVEENPDAKIIAFTFNFNGIAGEEGLYAKEYPSGSFWNETGILVYNMVVDHPLYYHKYMPFLPSSYVHVSIDRNHVRYMKKYFPEVHLYQGDIVPLGGTELNKDGCVLPEMRYLPMNRRPTDVIFTGNYTPPAYFEKYIAHMEKAYQDFYHGLVEEAIAHPKRLIEDLLEESLRAESPSLEELKAIMPNMMFVDLSVRFYYRAKVIAALADSGIKVHMFGAGWDLLPCRHKENIVAAGSVDSQECIDRISQSKLSVNVMPWFKDGAHDRIFNSMLNGAVSVSDPSVYLSEQFTDGEDIVFYDLENIGALGERVAKLLKDTEKMQQIADRAYEKCRLCHTWEERVNRIVQKEE